MKDIRKLILSTLILIIGLPVMGQVSYGVKAGGAYSCLVQKVGQTYKAGARFGFSLGGIVDIPLYKGLSLRPELAFVNQGGSFLSNFEVDGARNLYNKCNYYSIQIPVNLAYTFTINEIKLGLYAGPAADFSLFGKMKSNNQDVDIQFGKTKETDLKTFDLGVGLGLRVDYEKYFFSIGAICGTLDRRGLKREGESSLYQNNVTLSLGYMFR